MTILASLIHRQGIPLEECNQCGKCSSGCPAARLLELKPRQIVLMVQRGMIDELIRSKVIWECTQCHQCMERCPRGSTPFDVIIQLQNLAVKAGLPHPEGLDQILATIARTGSVQSSQEVFDSEFEGYTREGLGLPKLAGPLDLAAFKRAVEETARW